LANRYNNKRIVKSIQTIGVGRLLPGMILNATKLKKLFTVADFKKTELDEVENLISLKENYFRLQIANPKKRSAMTPKRFYSDVISADKYFKQSYRSYKLTKLTSLKVTQINMEFIK